MTEKNYLDSHKIIVLLILTYWAEKTSKATENQLCCRNYLKTEVELLKEECNCCGGVDGTGVTKIVVGVEMMKDERGNREI